MRQGVDSLNLVEKDNRASVLDLNDLDDFLTQAEMANREFASERQQFVVLDPTAQEAAEEHEREQQHKTITWSDDGPMASNSSMAFQELSVPRRPQWDKNTTPAELDKRERESFLEWRRAIAEKEEEIILKATSPLGVTPFEKNIDIWRQLWRVMERCSCIVQIVDARNPLFYLSKDLKAYATQELKKPMLLLINKSDYLSPVQRKAWHEYFSHPDHPWEHVFFSAHDEQEVLDNQAAKESAQLDAQEPNTVLSEDDVDADPDQVEESPEDPAPEEPKNETPEASFNTDNVGVEKSLSRNELLEWLLAYSKQNDCPTDPKYERIPFGMVGFPNVGKSSVINVLMGNAKFAHGCVRVAVAAQPGKTKHFQTLLLPDRENMLLVDCPGLVFPSFVNNTADLIAAGVYPIAQMRDPWPVTNLLCKRIPREVLNAQYGIQIPMPSADAMIGVKDGTIPSPTAEDFLTTFCIARSMLAANSGVPDFQRASRVVIKEYASGKLLYCHAPPFFDDAVFQKQTFMTAISKTKKLREKLLKNGITRANDNLSDSEDNDDDDASDNDEPGIEDDDMLLELMGGASLASSSQQQSKTVAKSTRPKKWGKKGHKFRNKDPYGCHSTPDEMLADDGAPMGVSVKAGGKKHSRKGYTRPTGYGMARSVLEKEL